jgi:hypothetical protein
MVICLMQISTTFSIDVRTTSLSYVHMIIDVRQIEMHMAEPLVPDIFHLRLELLLQS